MFVDRFLFCDLVDRFRKYSLKPTIKDPKIAEIQTSLNGHVSWHRGIRASIEPDRGAHFFFKLDNAAAPWTDLRFDLCLDRADRMDAEVTDSLWRISALNRKNLFSMKITGEFLYRFCIITVKQLALYCSFKFADIVNTVCSRFRFQATWHILTACAGVTEIMVCKYPSRQYIVLSILWIKQIKADRWIWASIYKKRGARFFLKLEIPLHLILTCILIFPQQECNSKQLLSQTAYSPGMAR